MANMVMGIIILNKKYTVDKYLSVFMITMGIILCTVISGHEVKSTQVVTKNSVPTTPMENFLWWILGIALLTFALFVSARMGLYQEVLSVRYGKHPQEALYYTVIYILFYFPLFLLKPCGFWSLAFGHSPSMHSHWLEGREKLQKSLPIQAPILFYLSPAGFRPSKTRKNCLGPLWAIVVVISAFVTDAILPHTDAEYLGTCCNGCEIRTSATIVSRSNDAENHRVSHGKCIHPVSFDF